MEVVMANEVRAEVKKTEGYFVNIFLGTNYAYAIPQGENEFITKEQAELIAERINKPNIKKEYGDNTCDAYDDGSKHGYERAKNQIADLIEGMKANIEKDYWIYNKEGLLDEVLKRLKSL